jgi:uncharacterized protein (TIGR03435 family)
MRIARIGQSLRRSPETLLQTAAIPIAILAALLLTSACPSPSYAQTGTGPAFEVASVKRSDPSRRSMMSTKTSPGQYVSTNQPLRSLIMNAYGVKAWRFVAPDWLRTERYDVVARVPEGATKEQVNLMLRNLLAERLGLVVHTETRIQPVFELVVDKDGPKFQKSKLPPGTEPAVSFVSRGLPTDKDGWPVVPAEANGISTARVGEETRWMFRNQRIPALIDILEMHVVQAVFDKTGLTGTYDFDLNIRSDSPPTGLGAGSMEPGPRSDPALTMML